MSGEHTGSMQLISICHYSELRGRRSSMEKKAQIPVSFLLRAIALG